jgi:mannose-6-phosphate isomerase
MSLYPFTFKPIFKERIWGGRRLASLYGKPLPPDVPIGESWEVSDRPGDESVISNGPHAGKTLRWLMEQHASDLLGEAPPAAGGRFPLLCKLLDARDRLSLQVHPPAGKARELQGEPKTEMWHITDAEPGAELFVGLKRGVTRAEFESRLHTGDVADLFHRIRVQAGDTMFLPSGRVHAIGAGLVIVEIQQNSDTTYRVFDWNRVGLDGAPRELHIAASLASIDFDDFEPRLVDTRVAVAGDLGIRPLVRDPLFDVDSVRTRAKGSVTIEGGRMRIAAVTAGSLVIAGGRVSLDVRAGQFCLVPASLPDATLTFDAGTSYLMIDIRVPPPT